MTLTGRTWFPVAAATLLLGSVCLLRSGVLVDTTFLIRFNLLALILAGLSFLPAVRSFRDEPGWYSAALVAFWLWNLISSLWSVAPSETLVQAQVVFLSLAVYIVLSALARRYAAFDRVFSVAVVFVLAGAFILGFLRMGMLEYYDPYRIISLAANNNLFAGFLILALPFTLTAFHLSKGAMRYAALLAGVLTVFFLIIIQSRAAYTGLLLGSVLLAVLLPWKYRDRLTRRNLATGALALSLLAAATGIFYASLDPPRQKYFLSKIPVWQYVKKYDRPSVDSLLALRRAGTAGNLTRGEFDFSEAYYENANLRLIFWQKSATLIRENPLAGVGAGNWRLRIPAVAEPPNPDHTRRNFTYSQPHNEWICIQSELGLPGSLLAWAVYLGPLALFFLRIRKKNESVPIPAAFLAAFLSGFFLFACFDFPLRRIEHTVLLFAGLAFLLYFLRPSGHPAARSRQSRPDRLRIVREAATRWLLPALLLLTLLPGTARMRGEYYTLKMFVNEGKNDDRVIRFSRLAGNPFYRITPNALPLDWFEGVAWFRKGEPATALACFEKALQYTPFEVRVLNDYAAALFSLKRTADAKAILRNTLKLDPFFDEARFNLAAMHHLTGHSDSALVQVRMCRESVKKKEYLEELEKAVYPQ